MSSKAKVSSIDMRDDGSVIVIYDTGTYRPYKSMDVLPKTVKAWIEAHQTEPEAPETAPEPPTEADTEPIQATEATEAPEPVRYPFILVGLPYDAVQATTEPIQAEKEPEPAPEATAAETGIVIPSIGALATLAGLGLAWVGVSAGVYACEILALTLTVTQFLYHFFREMYKRAKVRFLELVSRSGKIVQAAAQKATRRTRKAIQAGKDIGTLIYIRMKYRAIQTAIWSLQAGQAVKAWAVDAWEWRRQLIQSETVIG